MLEVTTNDLSMSTNKPIALERVQHAFGATDSNSSLSHIYLQCLENSTALNLNGDYLIPVIILLL